MKWDPGYYLIRQTTDQEPEPARWDGEAWWLIGCPEGSGDEVVEVVIGPLDMELVGFV